MSTDTLKLPDVYRRGNMSVKEKSKWPSRFVVLDNDTIFIFKRQPDNSKLDRVVLKQSDDPGVKKIHLTRNTFARRTDAKRNSFEIRIFDASGHNLVHVFEGNTRNRVDRTMWMKDFNLAIKNAQARYREVQRIAEQQLPAVPSILDAAYGETRDERRDFDEKQMGTPMAYKNRFFFVNFGISVLEAEQRRRGLIMEIGLYTVFVALFLLYLFTNVWIPDGAYLRTAMTSQFLNVSFKPYGEHEALTLTSIASESDFTTWLKQWVHDSDVFTGTVGMSNVVLGAVRLRQHRVKRKTDCTVTSTESLALELNLQNCYPPYSSTDADEAPFLAAAGVNVVATFPERVVENGEATYSYTSVVDAGKVFKDGQDTGITLPPPLARFSGQVGSSYPPGAGYIVDLPTTSSTEAAAIVEQLVLDRWFGDPTRAVFVTFNVYNPNINVFAFTQLLVEFPASGGARTDITFRPFRYPGDKFKDGTAYNDWPARVALGLLVVVYFVKLARSVYWKGGSAWDLMDLFNLSIILLSLFVRVLFATDGVGSFVVNAADYLGTTSYVNLDGISWIMSIERVVNGFNVILCFFKFFKFLRVDVRLSVVLAVIFDGRYNYLSFLVLFVFLALGFMLMGFLFYGPMLEAFHTTNDATMTILNLIVGKTDYIVTFVEDPDLLEFSNGYLALSTASTGSTIFLAQPAYFYILFSFVFVMLLTNLLIVISIRSFKKVAVDVMVEEEMSHNRSELKRQNNLRAGHSLSARFARELERFLRYSEGQRVVNRLKGDTEILARGYLSYRELQQVLADTVPPARISLYADRMLDVERVNLTRVRDVLALFDTPRVLEVEREERERLRQIKASMGDADEGEEEALARKRRRRLQNRTEAATGMGGEATALVAATAAMQGKGEDSSSEEEEEAMPGEEETKAGGEDDKQRLLAPGAKLGAGAGAGAASLFQDQLDTVDKDDVGLEMTPFMTAESDSDDGGPSAGDIEDQLFMGLDSPLGRVLWVRDLRRGEVFHAMVFAMLLKWEKDREHVLARLQEMYLMERELLSRAHAVEGRLRVVQETFTDEPLEPWDDPETRERMVLDAPPSSAFAQALKRQMEREAEEREREERRERGELSGEEKAESDEEDFFGAAVEDSSDEEKAEE